MRIRTIIIGGAILSIVVGFVLGKTVIAESPAPGSSADPVVSKSYVDKAMGDRVKELETQVAELTVQSQALQNTINELQAKVSKTPIKTTTTPTITTPSTGTTTPSTGTTTPGTTTPSTGSSVVGKTAYVSGTTSVNLRKGPSTSEATVGKVSKDDVMTILQTKAAEDKKIWYQVSLNNGTIGWVASWVVVVK